MKNFIEYYFENVRKLSITDLQNDEDGLHDCYPPIRGVQGLFQTILDSHLGSVALKMDEHGLTRAM